MLGLFCGLLKQLKDMHRASGSSWRRTCRTAAPIEEVGLQQQPPELSPVGERAGDAADEIIGPQPEEHQVGEQTTFSDGDRESWMRDQTYCSAEKLQKMASEMSSGISGPGWRELHWNQALKCLLPRSSCFSMRGSRGFRARRGPCRRPCSQHIERLEAGEVAELQLLDPISEEIEYQWSVRLYVLYALIN
jgi:hypothetical protein